MVDREVISATEQQWFQARTRMRTLAVQSAALAVTLIAAGVVPATFLASRLTSGSGRYLLTAGFMLLASIPLTGVIWFRMDRQQRLSNQLMKTLRSQLKHAIDEVQLESGRRHEQVRRQDFERRLASALEMADGEPEVIEVIERALASVVGDSATELLLADNSHAHLGRVAFVAPDGQAPSCSVDSPHHCPAARRAQVQHFDDSDALDACPKLRHRSQGRSSALCVPVSIMGRTVGVLHTVGPAGIALAADKETDLTVLADQVGARIGLLRVIAESQLQASTDSLTGLLNRRSMANQVRELRRNIDEFSVVVADLDNFKALNDTYGHDTGDRALRLFASTFASTLRREDLVSRHGGEEFVAVLPGCSGLHARAALDTVRTKLRAAATEHGLPAFTCSFGIAEADDTEDFTDVISRADVALFEAKRTGRDRAVIYDGLRDLVPLPMASPSPVSS